MTLSDPNLQKVSYSVTSARYGRKEECEPSTSGARSPPYNHTAEVFFGTSVFRYTCTSSCLMDEETFTFKSAFTSVKRFCCTRGRRRTVQHSLTYVAISGFL